MRAHLTEIAVRSLKPIRGKQTKVWDTSTPGFGIRINNTKRSWVVMRGQERRLKVIGQFPDMPLATARTQAKKLLLEPAALSYRITFAEALPRFIDENYRDKRESTKKEMNRSIRRHFFPKLHRHKMIEITDRDIGKCLDMIHARSEKLHAFRAARAFFNWCAKPPRRFLQLNPFQGYEAPGKDVRRSRVLSEAELAAVWKAANGPFGDMIKLLVLLGLRKGEASRMRWTWFADGEVTIPANVAKNGRAHTLAIMPMAQAMFDAVPRSQSTYLFPHRWDAERHFTDGSWGKLKEQLDRASGVTDWTLHDLRRTFATNLAKLGVSQLVVEKLLNHTVGSAQSELAAIYNRYSYAPEMREALRRYEAHIAKIIET